MLFGLAIVQVWVAASRPTYSEGFLYVATGLATLVGSVMAVAFNVRPPGSGAQVRAAPVGAVVSRPAAIVHAVADYMPAFLAIAYVSVYLVLGLAAVGTWTARPDVTSDLIKNLATTFLGLVLPIAGSFFRVPT